MKRYEMKRYYLLLILMMLSLQACSEENNDCLQQAKRYEDEGFKIIEEHSKECGCTYADEKASALLEKAMNSYVCAAEKGSADAALHASQLSSTGFIKPLDTFKDRELLRQALKAGHAKAGLWLYNTYCSGGDKCESPNEAEVALLETAKVPKGDILVAYTLGVSLRDGKFEYVDYERALDCFRIAKPEADDTVKKLIARFESSHPELLKKQNLKTCFQRSKK